MGDVVDAILMQCSLEFHRRLSINLTPSSRGNKLKRHCRLSLDRHVPCNGKNLPHFVPIFENVVV